jgi:hypothetical protein
MLGNTTSFIAEILEVFAYGTAHCSNCTFERGRTHRMSLSQRRVSFPPQLLGHCLTVPHLELLSEFPYLQSQLGYRL